MEHTGPLGHPGEAAAAPQKRKPKPSHPKAGVEQFRGLSVKSRKRARKTGDEIVEVQGGRSKLS